MKRILFLAMLLTASVLFSQDIRVDYAVIDELFEDENLSMVLRIYEGAFAVKEAKMVLAEIQSGEESFYKMEVSGNIASVSVDSKSLPKTDFYYYFEVTKKNNEVMLFPKIPSERLRNKVSLRKQEEYRKTEAVLLSPSAEGFMPENFLFAAYVNGKVSQLRLIVDGEDVTEKCIVGERMITYNPGRIFQPRKYRFDVINDGAILQTYYFDFASENLIGSFFGGRVSAYSGYDARLDKSLTGSLLLNLHGGISSFSYSLDAAAGNSSSDSLNYLENYRLKLSFGMQSAEAGLLTSNQSHAIISQIKLLGGRTRLASGKMRFAFSVGRLHDDFSFKYSSPPLNTASAAVGLATGFLNSQAEIQRFKSNAAPEGYAERVDDIVISHYHTLSLWGERINLVYSGSALSSEKENFSNEGLFGRATSDFGTLFLSSYSQRAFAGADIGGMSLSAKYSDVTTAFNALHLSPIAAGKRELQLKIEMEPLGDRLILGVQALLSNKRDTSFFNLRNPGKRSFDAYVILSGDGMPSIAVSYLDRSWLSLNSALSVFSQRMYGGRATVSGDFILMGLDVRSILSLEQLNYRLADSDSSEFSTGRITAEMNAGIYSGLHGKIYLSGAETWRINGRESQKTAGAGISYENLFSVLTPEISFSASFHDDTLLAYYDRTALTASIVFFLKEFSAKIGISELTSGMREAERREYLLLFGKLTLGF